MKRQTISECRDDMLRVAASLKNGHVTTSLLVTKLQANVQTGVGRALVEYGRLCKTEHALRYLATETYRRRIGAQLNNGEALHALRRFLVFGNLAAHDNRVLHGAPRLHEKARETKQEAVQRGEIRCTPTAPIQDNQLMFDDQGLSEQSFHPAGADQLGDTNDQLHHEHEHDPHDGLYSAQSCRVREPRESTAIPVPLPIRHAQA